MKLTMNKRRVGAVTIIDMAGPIQIGEGVSALRETLRELVANDQKQLLLNLGNVSYIDSAGLGELVGGFTGVGRNGGELKLLNLTKRVKDLLQITKLVTVFEAYDDQEQAIQSFTVDGDGAAPANGGEACCCSVTQ